MTANRPVFDGDVPLVKREAAEDVVTLSLERPAEFANARPGQFAMVATNRPGGPLLARPMSILSAEPHLKITFTIFGEATERLAETQPGETVHVFGPLGRPFLGLLPGLVIVTDGTHFGTLLGLAQERSREGQAAHVVFVTRPPDWRAGSTTAARQDAVLADRFAAVARTLTTTPLDGLEAELEASEPDAIAAGAGNAAMAIVQSLADRRGIEGQAALQTAMPCGLGACQGCIFPLRDGGHVRVCDGPVFPLDAPAFAA
jgi:dihydroorotate dehydrogenase electron transfer subunit